METELAPLPKTEVVTLRDASFDDWIKAAQDALAEAKLVAVDSPEAAIAAEKLRRQLAERHTQMYTLLDHNCQKLHKLHRESTADRDAVAGPYNEAAKIVKQAGITYDQEQKRIAEQRRIEAERAQRREEEARRLADLKRAQEEEAARLELAAKLEALGMTEEAEKALEEAAAPVAEAIEALKAPIDLAPVAAQKIEKPKTLSYRRIYSAEVIDELKFWNAMDAGQISKSFRQPNLGELKDWATKTKGEIKMPGVSVTWKDV